MRVNKGRSEGGFILISADVCVCVLWEVFQYNP